MPRPQRDPDPGSLIGHFGSELRRRRTMGGLSMARLGTDLGCTPQWISAVEQGDKPPSEAFALDLDTYYKADGAFHHLWKSIKQAGGSRVLLPGFTRYLELEARAVFIRSFKVQLVPGLLQTEAYIRAVMATGESHPGLEERVARRLERQQILHRERPPKALFVLDESVLYRPLGGADVMREQLDRLVDIAGSPNVQVRILPFRALTYAGLDGAFTMLSFARDSDLVYSEAPGISRLIEDKDTVADCAVRFDLVMGEALPLDDSIRRMTRAREDYR